MSISLILNLTTKKIIVVKNSVNEKSEIFSFYCLFHSPFFDLFTGKSIRFIKCNNMLPLGPSDSVCEPLYICSLQIELKHSCCLRSI